VGVRFRVTSSFMMVPEGSKRSFGLSLDYAHPDQRLAVFQRKQLQFRVLHERVRAQLSVARVAPRAACRLQHWQTCGALLRSRHVFQPP
jgi:hypothetical protein